MGWGERFKTRDDNRRGSLEVPQKPIVPSPADGPNGSPAAQLDAAPSMVDAVLAVHALRQDRDALWGWCFEASLILHRVRDHGMETLTELEQHAVIRVSDALDPLVKP